MNFFLILMFLLVNILQSTENYVRISIVPEYEQNLTTVLISVNRSNLDEDKELFFTLPDDVDSVYLINRNKNNQLSFTSIEYIIKNGLKIVTIMPNKKEAAYMILTNRYQTIGKRNFNYRLFFSEKINELELELNEPIMAENFSYTGFLGEKFIEKDKQKSIKKRYLELLKNKIVHISFEYINKKGTTTKAEIDEILRSDNSKDFNFDKNKKIVKRYNLYVWETFFALFLICIFILVILFIQNNSLKIYRCLECGFKVKNSDLFCSKCGEKLNVPNNL